MTPPIRAPRPARPVEQRNSIPVAQNTTAMLDLIRAKRALYDAAQSLYTGQFVVLVVIPLALAILKLITPAAASHAAVAGVLLFLLDRFGLEPRQKDLKTLAAKMQERFDCSVLHMSWRRERNGAEPTPEEIDRWARRRPSVDGLRDWYPPEVGRLPLAAARIACQRANGVWNAHMRLRYANVLRVAGWAVPLLLLGIAYLRGDRVQDFGSWVATLLPLLQWTWREEKRQRDSAAASSRLVERAMSLWRRTVAGGPDAPGEAESRELQNDLFDQRKSDQQVFAFVYHWFRTDDERAMRVAADALVTEFEARNAASAAPAGDAPAGDAPAGHPAPA